MARKITKTQTTDIAQELAFDCTALYIRVSTDKQADEGFSLDAQRTRLDAYLSLIHISEPTRPY